MTGSTEVRAREQRASDSRGDGHLEPGFDRVDGRSSVAAVRASGMGDWLSGRPPISTMRFLNETTHAISEACGLILVSHLFPEFREAATWSRLGRRVLAAQLRRQIYADGSYIQHSMNYHRVMLDMRRWGCVLANWRIAPLIATCTPCWGEAASFCSR